MSHRSTGPSFARFRTRASRRVERDAAESVAGAPLGRYLVRHPDRRTLARTFVVVPERVAVPERGVRIE